MAVENLVTDWTLVQVNSQPTRTSTRATGVLQDRDENGYLVRDFGAGHFDTLDVDFTIYHDSASAAGIPKLHLQATVTNFGWIQDIVYNVADLHVFTGETTWIRFSRQRYSTIDNWTGASEDTPYYLTLIRVADSNTATLEIYDDAPRTNLVDTLVVAGLGTGNQRYITLSAVFEDGGGSEVSGYVENVDLNEAVAGSPMYAYMQQ